MQLSERQREAFILRHAFGYRVNEIADMMRTPQGTIKDRLVTARKQLRKMLTRGARPPPSSLVGST
jgi:RNA polymerase sigma factor (sigma-70 family)